MAAVDGERQGRGRQVWKDFERIAPYVDIWAPNMRRVTGIGFWTHSAVGAEIARFTLYSAPPLLHS